MTCPYEYFSSGAASNDPWITQNALVGTYESTLTTIKDNPAGHYPDPPLDDYLLALVTKGVGHATVDVGAGVIKDDICAAGIANFTAAGMSADYQVHCMFSLCILSLPKTLMAQAVEKSATALDFEDLHTRFLRDLVMERMISQLQSETDACNPQGSLYSDQILHAVAAQLVSQAGQTPKRPARVRRLSSREIDLVVQQMDADLENRLTLDDLASPLNMTVYQFARAFQHTMGETPYRYLLLRRVARAQAMINDPRLSLAEISYACGFSNQAHMTTAFGKYAGYSPGAARRAANG